MFAAVREITDGKGVDIIIDVNAAASAGKYGELLSFGGDVVIYGSRAAVIALPFRPMIVSCATRARLQPAPSGDEGRYRLSYPLLEQGALQRPRIGVFLCLKLRKLMNASSPAITQRSLSTPRGSGFVAA